MRNSRPIPITSPVDRISGPRITSTPGNFTKGKTASLTETWGRSDTSRTPSSAIAGAQHHPGRQLGERQPDRLRDERHGPRRARVDLEHVDRVALDRELDVEEAHHAQLEGEGPRLRPEPLHLVVADRVRRERARRVAGVDARLLDVLHHAADQDVLAVAERVDVDLEGVLEELVDQDGVVGRDVRRLPHPLAEARLLVDDLHRPAAQDVGGAHQHRIAEASPRSAPPRRRSAPSRWAAAGARASGGGRRSARGPPPGRSRPGTSRGSGRPPARAAPRASAASGPRTGRSPRAAAPSRRCSGRPRGSGARSRAGPRCRSRSTPSPGCS